MISPSSMNQGQPYRRMNEPYAVIAPRTLPIDPQIAPGWPDLRIQAEPGRQPTVERPVVNVDIPYAGASENTLKISSDTKNFEPDNAPVVYIDLPEHGASTAIQNRENEIRERTDSNDTNVSRVTAPGIHQMYLDQPYPPNPIVTDPHSNLQRQIIPERKHSLPDTVYIDIPDNGSAGVIDISSHESTGTKSTSRPGTLKLRKPPSPPKPTTSNNDKNGHEDPPVVYIDLPEQQNSSTTVQRGTVRLGDSTNSSTSERFTNDPNESDFIQETIFYDQFKNRRIEVEQISNASNSEATNSHSELILNPTQSPYAARLGSLYSNSLPAETQPPLIPITEFPKPPPAYSEINTTPPPSFPRTEVIVPNNQNAIGMASSERKLVSCPHCSRRVHTITVRENAWITHIIAIILLFLFLPLIILVYWTDYFKYINHYCPNCNKLIGYEIPMFCQGMTYTRPVL